MLWRLLMLVVVAGARRVPHSACNATSYYKGGGGCLEERTRLPTRVHLVKFSAQWGGLENYYHFLLGRLLPLASWIERHLKRGDRLVLVETDSYCWDRRTPKILEEISLDGFEFCARYVMKREENQSFLPAAAAPLVEELEWPEETGWDMLLYGCGSLDDESTSRLRLELSSARRVLRRSCGCRREEANATRGVTLVDRGDDRKRQIPNAQSLETAIRDRGFEVSRVNFARLTPCDQWCLVSGTKVLVGQHGAGLANAAFLEPSAALIEIVPKDMAFKTIYPCLASLVGARHDRIVQNGTRDPVDPEAVADAVSRIVLTTTPVVVVVERKQRRFPRLSHSMNSVKCPKRHKTNVLARSGQCGDDSRASSSPTLACYDRNTKSRDEALRACAYAVATMVTAKSQPEFELFFRTFARYEPLRTLYVACDTKACRWLSRNAREIHPDTRYVSRLDKYAGKSRPELIKQKTHDPRLSDWASFQLEKAWIMRLALEKQSEDNNQRRITGVLFVDCDLVFLGPLPMMSTLDAPLGLSRHGASRKFERRYGAWNGGMVFARRPEVLDDWRNATARSHYFEQAALVEVAQKHAYFAIDSRANVGWYQVPPHKVLNLTLAERPLLRADVLYDEEDDDAGPPSKNTDGVLLSRERVVHWHDGRRVQSVHAHVFPDKTPSYYPEGLVPRLRTLMEQLEVKKDLCAVGLLSSCGGGGGLLAGHKSKKTDDV